MAKQKKKRQKHHPQRTCVGCRTVQEKRSLIRIVRSSEGVRVDPEGKAPGRGAYLHNNRQCWVLGLDKRLGRALKTEISAEDHGELVAFIETLPDND